MQYRFHNGNPNQKYSCNEDYFEVIDNEQKAYWLGFLYADGNVRIRHGRSGELKIKLSITDKEHIELFNKCINSNYPIRESVSRMKYKDGVSVTHSATVVVSNSKMVRDLIKIGCVENKTFKITFPIFLPRELRRHFIRGYFDGDGCIYIKKNIKQVSIMGTLALLTCIKRLFSLYNFNSTISKDGNMYVLRVTHGLAIRTITELFYQGATVYLKRKKEKFDYVPSGTSYNMFA